jgi:hypothetical protein
MDAESVQSLRERFPGVPFVLTHLGPAVDATGIADVVVPEDFETLSL